MFDWVSFFEHHNIEYVTAGANVSKGRVGINCPMCREMGDFDPSHHLTIDLSGKGWLCWRHRDHAGVKPTKLVAALLGCSYTRAAEICGVSATRPIDLKGEVEELLNSKTFTPTDINLKLPKEFLPFGFRPNMFTSYLCQRGYTDEQINRFTRRYGMYYVRVGPYHGRIMFTVYHKQKLVSWTGRTIDPTEKERYKTLSSDDGAPIQNYLLWFDNLKKVDADTIYVCEGPFDALRINVLGREHGIRATCLFTSHYSDEQRAAMFELLPRFEHRYLMLDREKRMLPVAMKMESDLSSLGVRYRMLPEGVNDPAELSKEQLLSL